MWPLSCLYSWPFSCPLSFLRPCWWSCQFPWPCLCPCPCPIVRVRVQVHVLDRCSCPYWIDKNRMLFARMFSISQLRTFFIGGRHILVRFCFVFIGYLYWLMTLTRQPENVLGSEIYLLLLRSKVEFQCAAGKVKIHRFQHVRPISSTCSIDRKFSVEHISRPTLVLAGRWK